MCCKIYFRFLFFFPHSWYKYSVPTPGLSGFSSDIEMSGKPIPRADPTISTVSLYPNTIPLFHPTFLFSIPLSSLQSYSLHINLTLSSVYFLSHYHFSYPTTTILVYTRRHCRQPIFNLPENDIENELKSV